MSVGKQPAHDRALPVVDMASDHDVHPLFGHRLCLGRRGAAPWPGAITSECVTRLTFLGVDAVVRGHQALRRQSLSSVSALPSEMVRC
jgi:hypothetical protein